MRWTKLKHTFWGLLRLHAYVACVGGAVMYVSFVRAYDRAERSLGELGFDMLAGLDALERGVEQVELNGQSFTFAATALPQLPNAVISEFEEHCERGSGALASDLRELVSAARVQGKRLPDGGPARWLTRSERAVGRDSAHSSCFLRDDAASGSFWESLAEFAESGRLSALGKFRYVRADRKEGDDVTRVLAIGSDGEFDLDALVPDHGDARGADPRLAPRPADAARSFSARIVRSGQGAYVYTSHRPPADVLKQYEVELPKRGMRNIELPAMADSPTSARAFAFGDSAVIVSATPGLEGETQIAIFELGRGAAAGGQ